MQDEWAVCRIFHKSTGIEKLISPIFPGTARINSSVDALGGSLPPLMDPASASGPSSIFTDAENNEFKGMVSNSSSISVSKSSDANFPNCGISSNPPRNIVVSNNLCPGYPLNPDSNFFVLYNQVQKPNFFSVQGSTASPAYLNQLATTIRSDQPQCKAEQFLSQSIISGRSQETGISTDVNTEISSSSKQEVASNRLLDELTDGSLPVGSINSSDVLDLPWDY